MEVEGHVHRGEGVRLVAPGALQTPPAGVDALGHGCGPLGHVVAVVSVGRGLVAVSASRERGCEQVDLATSVVHIELPAHPVAATLQKPAQRVAVGGPASMAGVQRTGGVGRNELDAHTTPRPDVVAGVAVRPLGHHRAQHLVQPGGRQAEVHEAGTGGLHCLHVRRRCGREVLDDLGGEPAGRASGRLGRNQRHVGGPVAVGAVPGPLDGDLVGHGINARSCQRAAQPVPQEIAHVRHRPILPASPQPLAHGHETARRRDGETATSCRGGRVLAAAQPADSMTGPALVAQGIEHRPPEP